MHNPFRYCGEYYDEETGLIYLRNRYYDSSTGRFITEDPAKDGLNWYSYCGGNPVMFVDPWGLFTEGDNLYVGGSNDKNDVKVLQNELKWLGLYSGEIDGSYGPATKKAVENYQSIMGLKVDGITGNNTWKSLGLLF